ncbi:hypothetical protein Taro_049051, partial [Colocasia esculenta]|nr:hypothetical protein [Colocasia esculenta]
MASGSTPPPSELVHADDETSHHEGDGSYSETMQAVWINEGYVINALFLLSIRHCGFNVFNFRNKIEPAQASQFITKTIQTQFPGPVHRFYNFPMNVQDLLYDMFMRNHRFREHSDELRARSTWTTTTRANFKHLLYNVQRNAERVCASIDKNQRREHGPVWMRKEYWMELCVIWGGEKWNKNSAKAKLNRVVHLEANVHTRGSVSFATHKARLVSTLLHL